MYYTITVYVPVVGMRDFVLVYPAIAVKYRIIHRIRKKNNP